MSVTRLQITSLRNISQASLNPQKGFNIIFGENGSGKTCLLEAIHILGLGRSFRSHLTGRIIQHDADNLAIFAEFESESGNKQSAGIEKQKSGQTRIRLNQEDQQSIAETASLLPLQLINTESYRLLDSGPKYRREFLDWGVFHVEQSFIECWRCFTRILKQRNAALKQGLDSSRISAWDEEFIELSEQLNIMREKYIADLSPIFFDLLEQLLDFKGFSLLYYRGWTRDKALMDLIEENLHRDRQLTYTYYGPHRADIRLTINGTPVQDELSRGQQKLYVYALRLAQGTLLKRQKGKSCIYLIDDLPAELDKERRHRIAAVLKNLSAQVFVTSVDQEGLEAITDISEATLFHVERGIVKKVV